MLKEIMQEGYVCTDLEKDSKDYMPLHLILILKLTFYRAKKYLEKISGEKKKMRRTGTLTSYQQFLSRKIAWHINLIINYWLEIQGSSLLLNPIMLITPLWDCSEYVIHQNMLHIFNQLACFTNNLWIDSVRYQGCNTLGKTPPFEEDGPRLYSWHFQLKRKLHLTDPVEILTASMDL